MRLASRATCWRWKPILERSPAYVMVALAVRGPTRTECGFLFCFLLLFFFRTVNETARPGSCLSLQKQWPAGAKLSLPDRHATRCWLKRGF